MADAVAAATATTTTIASVPTTQAVASTTTTRPPTVSSMDTVGGITFDRGLLTAGTSCSQIVFELRRVADDLIIANASVIYDFVLDELVVPEVVSLPEETSAARIADLVAERNDIDLSLAVYADKLSDSFRSLDWAVYLIYEPYGSSKQSRVDAYFEARAEILAQMDRVPACR